MIFKQKKSELYPSLTEKTVSKLRKITSIIRANPTSKDSKKQRLYIFDSNQKKAVIIYWFDRLSEIPLTLDEIHVVKTFLKGQSKSDWQIIKNLILNQKILDTQQKIELIDIISDEKRKDLLTNIIVTNKKLDFSFRLLMVQRLLRNDDYLELMLMNVDRNLLKKEDVPFWSIVFDLILDALENNADYAKKITNCWNNDCIFIDSYAADKKIESKVLFDITGKTQYLPQVAKDIFMM